jgi:hypothetical protein
MMNEEYGLVFYVAFFCCFFMELRENIKNILLNKKREEQNKTLKTIIYA